MDIMNVLRTGMNMSISHIRIMGMLQGGKKERNSERQRTANTTWW